jgi:hypothetical protein
MCVLEVTDFSLLELAAFRPLSYLPSNHRAAAERLRQQGLLRQENGQWHRLLWGWPFLDTHSTDFARGLAAQHSRGPSPFP